MDGQVHTSGSLNKVVSTYGTSIVASWDMPRSQYSLILRSLWYWGIIRSHTHRRIWLVLFSTICQQQTVMQLGRSIYKLGPSSRETSGRKPNASWVLWDLYQTYCVGWITTMYMVRFEAIVVHIARTLKRECIRDLYGNRRTRQFRQSLDISLEFRGYWLVRNAMLNHLGNRQGKMGWDTNRRNMWEVRMMRRARIDRR